MSPQILSSPSPRQKRQAKKAQSRERKDLVEKILKEGPAAAVAAVAVALNVTQARLTEGEVDAWQQDMEQRLDKIQQLPEQNLGFIEEELARASKEPLRLLAERAAQAKANATACRCPDCKIELARQQVLGRSIDSRFGRLKLYRKYGWCEPCVRTRRCPPSGTGSMSARSSGSIIAGRRPEAGPSSTA